MRIGTSESRRGRARARRKPFTVAVEGLEDRRLLATFTVTNTSDAGAGSLRQAILSANLNPGADAIRFAIPATTALGPGNLPAPGFDPVTQTWRITPLTPLPAITDTVNIDGYSQAHFPVAFFYPENEPDAPALITSVANTADAKQGNNAVVRVIIDGSQTSGGTGFVLNTSHSTLRGLIIDGFGVGVSVPDPLNVGNLIQGNFIGTHVLFPVDPGTGEMQTSLPGGVVFTGQGNSLQGVLVRGLNNTVGGDAAQDNNVITGNGLQGVAILAGSEGNQVVGNQIGIAGPSLGGRFVIDGNGAEGVLVASSSNIVGGVTGGAGNLISGNTSHGVRLTGAAATRNVVEGNFIGVGPGGGFLFGAGDPGNQGDGLLIEGAVNNRVGGTDTAQSNVISANEGAGVRIVGAGAVANSVAGNTIGLVAGGSSALGNEQEGVAVYSPLNSIGPGNIISANRRGVLLSGPDATGNVVGDNFIGTNSAGDADLGNAIEGVLVDGASDNLIAGRGIGFPGTTARPQVISGNLVGVVLIGPSTVRNRVLGNVIGTDLPGARELGNSQEGVRIENAPDNIIGSPSPDAGNLISGNHGGVVIMGPSALRNRLQSNYIGTTAGGTGPLGSEVDGVFILRGASDNLVGGETEAEGNTIAANIRDGVRVEDLSLRNAILTNRIYSNFGLGINLYVPSDPVSGVTPNDPSDADSGPNNLQNAPILTGVATSIAFTNIQGVIVSVPNTAYRIQFFASKAPDPSGSGEGERYLGETTVVTGADGVGIFSAEVPATLPAGQTVTATATDPSGNTSEFSAGIREVLGTVQFLSAGFVVNEGGGTATIIVTRSGGSGGAFTVDFATGGGTAIPGVDYVATSGTLEFGLGETTKTFTVTLLNDALAEADETIGLRLGNAVGAATLGTPSTAILTVLDDDQPGALQFSASGYVVDEAAGTATITVIRDSGGGAVTVEYSTSDGTARAGVDYVATSGVLTFGPGETSKTFTVPILLDTEAEGDETVILNLGRPTGGATLGSQASAVLTILNDSADRTGPRVTVVRPISARRGLAALVLSFNEALDPGRATDLLNYGYSLRTAGRDRRLGTRDDLIVGVRSATYDPLARTVTLTPDAVIHFGIPFVVTINQSTDVPGAGKGVSDTAGNLLDGNGDGRPGGVFREVLTARPGGARGVRTGSRPGRPRGRS